MIFPSEEEIMGKLSTADVSCPKTSEVAEEPFYDLSPKDMVAVVWDESGSLMWYIGIYLDTLIRMAPIK